MGKRDSSTAPGNDSVTPAPKKSRSVTNNPVASLANFSGAELRLLSTDILVDYILDIRDPAKQAPATPSSSASPSAPISEDPAKIKERAAKTANMMAAAVLKQMKWQPSCKKGGKRWAYEGLVPSEAVFFKLFNLKAEKKAWKQKKIPVAEFEKICGGDMSASVSSATSHFNLMSVLTMQKIRYGYLVLRGENVTLKWNKEENSFSVSGLYGLRVCVFDVVDVHHALCKVV